MEQQWLRVQSLHFHYSLSAAGLEAGDVLVSYNGVPLGPNANIRAERSKVQKGATVPLVVWRGGKAVELTLRAGEIGINGRSVVTR